MLAGCSVVPRSQLDECRKLSRTLQADNSRLKDTIVSLKTENEDLAQRADDDVRRLKSQDQTIQKLMASLHAYQDDREQLARGVERLKTQIRSATRPISSQFRERFDRFAKSEAGCKFDPTSTVVTIPSDLLFEPGTDQPTPKAHDLLATFAKIFDHPDAGDLRLLVTGHMDDSAVKRASFEGEAPALEHLSLNRASRVRELLSTEGHIESARMKVAGAVSLEPSAGEPTVAGQNLNRRIDIQISRSGALTPEPTANP